jgi:hypothetical protein
MASSGRGPVAGGGGRGPDSGAEVVQQRRTSAGGAGGRLAGRRGLERRGGGRRGRGAVVSSGGLRCDSKCRRWRFCWAKIVQSGKATVGRAEKNLGCGMKWHVRRLGRYVHRLTDEYTTMYIHRLTDKHTGHIFISFLFLRRFMYRGIYMSYIRNFKKPRNV